LRCLNNFDLKELQIIFKDTDLSFDVEDAQKEKYTSRAV
jgi:hypothetical protein